MSFANFKRLIRELTLDGFTTSTELHTAHPLQLLKVAFSKQTNGIELWVTLNQDPAVEKDTAEVYLGIKKNGKYESAMEDYLQGDVTISEILEVFEPFINTEETVKPPKTTYLDWCTITELPNGYRYVNRNSILPRGNNPHTPAQMFIKLLQTVCGAELPTFKSDDCVVKFFKKNILITFNSGIGRQLTQKITVTKEAVFNCANNRLQKLVLQELVVSIYNLTNLATHLFCYHNQTVTDVSNDYTLEVRIDCLYFVPNYNKPCIMFKKGDCVIITPNKITVLTHLEKARHLKEIFG